MAFSNNNTVKSTSGNNKKSKAAKGSGKGSSAASYRVQIANKAVSTSKKSGSVQDKRIAKQAIKRKKSPPGAKKRNVF